MTAISSAAGAESRSLDFIVQTAMFVLLSWWVNPTFGADSCGSAGATWRPKPERE
jgi:hypothetical protein